MELINILISFLFLFALEFWISLILGTPLDGSNNVFKKGRK